jgi:hypothetical protein
MPRIRLAFATDDSHGGHRYTSKPGKRRKYSLYNSGSAAPCSSARSTSQITSLRNSCSTCMLSYEWNERSIEAYNEYERIGPLWMRVEDALGEEEPPKTGWHRAASNWLRLLEEITTHPRRAEFDATLTRSQTTSWRILVDWWEGHYQSQDLCQVARTYIKAKASQPSSEQHLVSELDPETDKSFYHSCLFALFEMEFHPHAIDFDPRHAVADDGYMTLSDFYTNLANNRQLTLTQAASQRITFHCLAIRRESSTVSDTKLGATLQPCRWLPAESRNDGLPYYLWDIAGKQTIKTQSIAKSPSYTTISHTWGRWRI